MQIRSRLSYVHEGGALMQPQCPWPSIGCPWLRTQAPQQSHPAPAHIYSVLIQQMDLVAAAEEPCRQHIRQRPALTG